MWTGFELYHSVGEGITNVGRVRTLPLCRWGPYPCGQGSNSTTLQVEALPMWTGFELYLSVGGGLTHVDWVRTLPLCRWGPYPCGQSLKVQSCLAIS